MNNFWEKLMCCVYKIGDWIKWTILDIPSFIKNLGFVLQFCFYHLLQSVGTKKYN